MSSSGKRSGESPSHRRSKCAAYRSGTYVRRLETFGTLHRTPPHSPCPIRTQGTPPTRGRNEAMDQPTAEEALNRLEPLIGEWVFEAKPPDGPPWPGEARASIEWHDSGAHLVARSTVEMPEAPDSISIMGCERRERELLSALLRRARRLPRLRNEHRRRRVEALARRRTVRAALQRDDQRRRQHDRWPLGEGAGRAYVGD